MYTSIKLMEQHQNNWYTVYNSYHASVPGSAKVVISLETLITSNLSFQHFTDKDVYMWSNDSYTKLIIM